MIVVVVMMMMMMMMMIIIVVDVVIIIIIIICMNNLSPTILRQKLQIKLADFTQSLHADTGSTSLSTGPITAALASGSVATAPIKSLA